MESISNPKDITEQKQIEQTQIDILIVGLLDVYEEKLKYANVRTIVISILTLLSHLCDSYCLSEQHINEVQEDIRKILEMPGRLKDSIKYKEADETKIH